MNRLAALAVMVCFVFLLAVLPLSGASSTPSNPQKKFAQGVVFYQKRDYLKALVTLNNLYKDYPIYNYARILIAKSYTALGRYEKALEVLEDKGGKEWSLDYEINLCKARTFLKANRLDKAQKAAESAYQSGLTDREKIPALRLLVNIFSGRGKYVPAVDNLFKLIELSNLRFS